MKFLQVNSRNFGYSGGVDAGFVMLRGYLVVVAAAVSAASVLSSAGTVSAEPAAVSRTSAPSFMRVFGLSQAPYGFVRFCDANPTECADDHRGEQRIDATPQRLSELDDVNRAVNRAIRPLTDMELYGVTEYWTLPREAGDCEDYALLKRRILLGRGWPASALLLTVVRDERGEGHAVLTARTAQGDFVLDNKAEGVKLWSRTPYQFVMRQSYLNPKVWVALESGDAVRPAAIAGVQSQR